MNLDKHKVHHGWHFLRPSKRLRNGDERLVKKGEWMEMCSPWEYYYPDKSLTRAMSHCSHPVIGKAGMHASKKIIDALRFARVGDILCEVEVVGDVCVNDNQFCGRFRRVLRWGDITEPIREFALLIRNHYPEASPPTDLYGGGYIMTIFGWPEIARTCISKALRRYPLCGNDLEHAFLECVKEYSDE